MIADKLTNSTTYNNLGERFQTAFEYLQKTDLSAMEPQTIQLDGDKLFILLQEYDTKDISACKYESHEKYVDIQYIISGVEMMGYAPLEKLALMQDARPAKDNIYYRDENNEGSLVKIEAGMFAIFYPWDGHMPNIACGQPCRNKKAVVKILL